MRRLLICTGAVSAALAAGAPVAVPAHATWNGRCAVRTVPYTTSGGGVEAGRDKLLRGPMLVDARTAYLAEGTVTLTMQGTTFAIAPGTSFRPECFGADGDGPYPSIKLYLGKIKVTQPSGGGPAQTGVRTWEGVAQTISPGAATYTVSRDATTPADGDAGQGHMTVKVTKGGPIMLSPRAGMKAEWPCTTGQTFSVDWLGRVTKL